MEHTVGTGQFEAGTFRHAHQSRQLAIEIIVAAAGRGAFEMQTVRIAEEQAYAAVRVASEAQHRRAVHRNAIHAVDLPQRAIGKAFAGRALVQRVDVVVFAAVDRADGVHVVYGLRGVPLGLTQHRPAHRIVAVRSRLAVDPLRQLHDEERQIFAPQRTPFADHHAEQLAVGTAVLLVFLTLIPQETGQRVGHDTFQHGVEGATRTPLRCRGERRRPRAGAALFAQLAARCVRIGLTHRFHSRVPCVHLRLPFAGFQLELLLRLACDRTLVARQIVAAGIAGIECVLAHPAADRRAADIAVDNADRQIGVEFGAQLACEIVGDGTHHTTVFRRRFLPARRIFRIAIDDTGFGHIVETQQRIGAILKCFVGMLAVTQLKFHIALAAGEPHFADKHVVEFDGIIARDDTKRVRTAFRLRGQHHAPLRKAVDHVLRRISMFLRDQGAVKVVYFRHNLHTGAIGSQCAEHRNGLVALQYHVRGENRGDMQHARDITLLHLLHLRRHFGTRRNPRRSDHCFSFLIKQSYVPILSHFPTKMHEASPK